MTPDVELLDATAWAFLAKTVKISNFLHGSWVLSAGVPEEIRTPDPQIRSLVRTVEIIGVRYQGFVTERNASVVEVPEFSSSRSSGCYRKTELHLELFIPQ